MAQEQKKKEALQKYIREIARAEIKKYVDVKLPIVLNEMINMKVEEMLTEQSSTKKSKRSKLNESLDMGDEEYRSVGTFGTTNMNKLLDLASEFKKAGSNESVPTTFTTTTEAGAQVAVPMNKLPEHLSKALTRDYRSLIKEMDKKRAV